MNRKVEGVKKNVCAVGLGWRSRPGARYLL